MEYHHGLSGEVLVGLAPDSTVEQLFADAPVVTADDAPVQAATTAQISALLSVAASDGDAITASQLRDGTSGGGALRIAGAAKAENQAINEMASQFEAVESLAGSSSGADQLWARAHDGTSWDEWKSFSITTLAG